MNRKSEERTSLAICHKNYRASGRYKDSVSLAIEHRRVAPRRADERDPELSRLNETARRRVSRAPAIDVNRIHQTRDCV